MASLTPPAGSSEDPTPPAPPPAAPAAPATESTANSSIHSDIPSALNIRCTVCHQTYSTPKVLDCFHTFCIQCLEHELGALDSTTVNCPECCRLTQLPPNGLEGLLDDIAVAKYLEASAMVSTGLPAVHCTCCKDKDSEAVSQCFDCANYLCFNCVKAHKFMHCFATHRVEALLDVQPAKSTLGAEKTVSCKKHNGETMKYFCKDCQTPICQECSTQDHKKHQCDFLADMLPQRMDTFRQLISSAKAKANSLRSAKKGIEHCSNKLQTQFDSAKGNIKKTADYCRTLVEEQHQSLVKELEASHRAKEEILSTSLTKTNDTIDQLYQGCEFLEKLLGYANPVDVLIFAHHLDRRMAELMHYQVDTTPVNPQDLAFVSNSQAIRAGIKNIFGYVKQGGQDTQSPTPMQQPQPIARPNGGQRTNQPPIPNGNPFEPLSILGKFGGSNSSLSSLNGFFMGPPTSQPYDAWSTGVEPPSSNGVPGPPGGPQDPHDLFPPMVNGGGGEVATMDLPTKLMNSTNPYPPKSQIKRQKMIYHCKFGEFGVNEGQFTEPSGVAVNAQNDIIVADTNNHRIQIFDKEGRFKFQFGQCGKLDGQLLYPNRVAVVKRTGDIVVTERSPTHQVQVFNQYGQFVRKFGANVLQHPRGVTVDYKSQIVIVECKVMRVIIFDMYGTVLQKFGCSKHLEFPNGVVVNDKQEIFISDNRAHCVKVFSYQGQYLRQIGGEGISNYPIGVGINAMGEVLIADNHNNFNLTVFTQDGQILNALESKVKHAQCFDVALLDEGSIVLASKDYRLYIYRYAQPAPLGPPPQPSPYGGPYISIHDTMSPLKLDHYS